MDVDAKGAWLESLGYRYGFQRNTWVECLITGHGETWRGAGWSEKEALDDALDRMFPSQASRELFRTRFEAGLSIEVAEDPLAPDENIDIPVDIAPDEAEREEQPSGADRPRAPVDEAIEKEEVSASISVHPPLHPAALTRRVFPGEAVEELIEIERTIKATQEELVFATAERQRLVMLAWIAQARSLAEALPSIEKVGQGVGRIAALLGGFCRAWWPGSVHALKQAATPSDAAREFGWDRPHDILSWAEVAERAEETLNRKMAEDDRRGYDEYGWADGNASYPAPSDIASLRSEVRRQLEAYTGPLEEPPASGRSAERMIAAYKTAGIVTLARKTRWLRIWTTDPMEWGAMIGRLRWLDYQGDHRLRHLRKVLKPDRLGLPWAQTLGIDPNKRQKQRVKRDLLESLSVGNPGEDPGWPKWLVSAFDVFETRRMAKLLARCAEEILSLDEEALLDVVEPDQRRRMRSRLKKLKESLVDSPFDDESALLELSTELSKVRDVAAEEEPDRNPHEALRLKALDHTKGRRALFVSNRNDPDLKDRLARELEFEELEWCDGSVRRSEGLAEAIRQARFDLVLLATGFQSHTLDNLLSRACRVSGIPFLRVNRGRPLAVYQAIERFLSASNGTSA